MSDNTLHQKNKKYWDDLARKKTHPNLVKMASMFTSYAGLDDALGFSNASSTWARVGRYPGANAERMATKYLDQFSETPNAPDNKQQGPKPEPAPKLDQPEAVNQTSPSVDIYMVLVDQAKSEKLIKILKLLDCQYETL